MSNEPSDLSTQLSPAAGARLINLQTRLDGAQHHPSVVVLAMLQPLMRHTQITSAAVTAAGGRPALDDDDALNSWDDVVWVQPEMLVLGLPSRSLDDAVEAFVAIADMPVWRDIPATYLNQIYVADLGDSLIDDIELLAGLLHPNRCDAPAPERARRVSPLIRTELRL